jgi:transposase
LAPFEKAVELLCTISGARRRTGRTRNGSKWLDWALEEAALAATRSKDTYLAAQYARLRPRGHDKGARRVKHSIIVACWHMLSTGELSGSCPART